MNTLFDICERKHGKNEMSVAANAKAEPTKQVRQTQILGLMQRCVDLTAKEAAYSFSVPLNTLSGRFSELKKLGRIEAAIGVKRDGSQAYRLRRTN